MSWDSFIIYAVAALVLWTLGAWAAWKNRNRLAYAATTVGLAVFFTFIVGLWVTLDRPPLRTMGETRLWYSLFLPMAGLLVYSRWKYKWILSFSTILAAVFIIINLLKPEIHNKTLMPALQSPWFAPHVIVYMMAYALLGAAFVMALFLLWKGRKATSDPTTATSPVISQGMSICDNLVYIGWAFLTIGMLFGALWAKEAWGTYWAWDPKETWAAATWFAYLVYIHHRLRPKTSRRFALWVLIVNFALLQMCWWGINYLPSAKGTSVHTYSMQ
jgi:ABC-type transport system involved in cytochrome c biogenesis permease subunit